MSAAEKAPPPRQLGRYEVIAEIASGGMGVVYLARHAGEGGFQRLFAIKLMHPHLAEDRVFVDMLRDEATIAARIHHPNVVPILDLASEAGRYYVVMEYVDGCSLAALLARNRKSRPPEIVVPILIDALDGLHAAHSLRDHDGTPLNLVHRDVSPQNILIGVDGMGRITDFGIAKAETRITSTRPGMRKGKISYMAPEQLIDDGENIDHRADVFAAGAVLWGALTAQPLFRAQSDGATLHNILNKQIPPPSSVGLEPPTAFDAVCLRALERDPKKRFESAAEMADALRAAAASVGVHGSRARVAQWVTTSFAAELEARKGAIQQAAARSRPPSADESLPALPALAGPPSLPTIPSARSSAPPPSLSSVSASKTVPPAHEEPTEAAFRPKRTALFVAAGAAALLVVVLAVWLAREPAGSAELATTPPPAPKPPPAATPESPVAEAPAAAKSSAPAEAPPTATPRAVAQPAVVPRRTQEAKPVAKPEPKPEPPPAPPPATTKPASPPPGMPLEKNPYLRRE